MWEARSFIEMTSFKIPILSPVQLILATSIDRKNYYLGPLVEILTMYM